MPIARFARDLATGGALAAALAWMAPAMAEELPGADMAMAPPPAPMPMPAAPPPPRLPDPGPSWSAPAPMPPMQPAPAVMHVDPRTRDMWLAECRRRMDIYYGGDDYDGGWKRHRRRESRGLGYDYCEVYFDDYYRHYAQAGYGYGMMRPHMMVMRSQAGTSAPAQNCVEEERVSYEPVRTRVIQRRVIRTKRVPDKRIRIR